MSHQSPPQANSEEYISVNRKHIFKFVSLCKFNTIHIKQLKRKTYILCQTKQQRITNEY